MTEIEQDNVDQSKASLKSMPPRRVVLLTGMSGAGLSTALKAFEDLGYESVDNLRLGLVPTLVADPSEIDPPRPLAVSIDSRNANFVPDEVLTVLRDLGRLPGIEPQLVFLDCSDEVLQRRFSETRRRHPLAIDRPVTDGIRRERQMLWRLRDEADRMIDTSLLSVHDLRRMIAGGFHLEAEPILSLFITSFAYRYGLPREADLVIDARFLANPYWDAELRGKTGLDPEVGAYVARDPDFASFMEHVTALILPLLPRYQQEGKSYLTIAIGCTGGRHRSVYVVEQLANALAGQGFIVGIGHRDLDRAASRG